MLPAATKMGTWRILAGDLKLKSQNSVEIAMARAMIAVAMIAVIVTVDVLIFKNHFWERLMVNIGIVLVFAAFYLRFLKHP